MPNVDSSEFTRLKRFKALRNDMDPTVVDQNKFRGPSSVSQPRVAYHLNFLQKFIPISTTNHSTFSAQQFSLIKRRR